jgi:hypothetical protein
MLPTAMASLNCSIVLAGTSISGPRVDNTKKAPDHASAQKPSAVYDVKYGRNWGDAKHTWDELHAETGHHAKQVEEITRQSAANSM